MATTPAPLLASLDGAIGPAGEARVPATDEGLLRGDGVFEVMRVYHGRPFALDEHLERLSSSAANLRLPADVAAVRADAERLLAAAGEPDCALRVVLTRGGRRLLLTEAIEPHDAPARLYPVTYSPPRILDGVKSLSYAGNMLASRLAREAGYDEALLVTPHGRVLEAPTSSLFWASGGRLFTPPLSEHILASITRARVVELTEAQERPCTLEELVGADEALLASTLREVQPVAAVGTAAFSAAPGPLTEEAGRLLAERIAAELASPAL
jgi:branched-chain amino acid aminotransferase